MSKYISAFLFITLITVATLAPLQSSHAQSAAALYKQGRESMMKFTPAGFDDAIKLFNQAVGVDPNYAPAYAGLGEVYSFIGFYRYLVKEDYEKYYIDSYENMVKALKLAPNSLETQLALAYTYLHLDREKDAMNAAQRVLAMDPDNGEGMYILWAAKGENPDSPEIRKALELSPNLIPAYLSLGTAYFYKKRAYSTAATYYNKAVELADSAQLHNYLGMAYNQQGLYGQAVNEYRKAIELNPDYAPAHMNLGITYYYMKKINDSINMQKKAISLNPNNPDAYFFIAQGYDKAQQNQEAIRYYRQFITMTLGQDRYNGYADTAKQRIAALGGG